MTEETTINKIITDTKLLAKIEYQTVRALLNTDIVFTDDKGNQYEYNGICLSNGKLKISINPIFNIRIN